jgi:hypothetical protein
MFAMLALVVVAPGPRGAWTGYAWPWPGSFNP